MLSILNALKETGEVFSPTISKEPIKVTPIPIDHICGHQRL
jgi:hypothetical protein